MLIEGNNWDIWLLASCMPKMTYRKIGTAKLISNISRVIIINDRPAVRGDRVSPRQKTRNDPATVRSFYARKSVQSAGNDWKAEIAAKW